MKLTRILILLIISNFFSTNAIALNKLKSIRIWPSPENTRVVFDLTESAEYKIFTLDNPYRVVIDLNNAKVQGKVSKLQLSNTRIKKIRIGIRSNDELRVVLETNEKLNPKAFTLKPNNRYGHRLVIDLDVSDSEKEKILALFDLDAVDNKNSNDYSIVTPKSGDFIVAIDCGHGGEDPGAIGRNGTMEKDVVLAIGKKLKELINKEPGMRAFLIRNGDYYVSLRDRVNRARKKRADLFISIHADAFHNQKATGASVFILSNKGASSEAARWLATKENNSDLIGGINLSGQDDLVASVLLDMSQTINNSYSLLAAKKILNKIGSLTPLHKNYVEKAGFVVLKAPDIPSILVETGFISNPATEKKLRSKWYQEKLAISIRDGIKEYYKHIK